MRRFLLAALALIALKAISLKAQQGPGWFMAGNLPATPPPEITLASGASGSISLLSEPVISEEITPEISALARNLENDPRRIYDYVHNYIRHVHYFGSKKGALLTLLERSGNDFDQCALLVALLRAAAQNSGATYTVTYQFGAMKMPYQSPDDLDLKHWLGLTLEATPVNFQDYRGLLDVLHWRRGYPQYGQYYLLLPQGEENNFIFHRVWVKLVDGPNTHYLDPAFKVSTPISGVDVTAAMQLDTADLLNQVAVGATVNSDYVKDLNWNNLTSKLTTYVANFLTDLQNNHPNLSVEQVIGGDRIQESETQDLPGLPFQPLTQSFVIHDGSTKNIPVQEWNNIPAPYLSTIRFQVQNENLDVTYYFPELRARKVSLNFVGSQAQISLDDQPNQTGSSASGLTARMITSIAHPFGTWDYAGNTITLDHRWDHSDQGIDYQRSAGGYVIVYGFDDPAEWLNRRQHRLDAMIRQGLDDQSPQVITETLNVMGLSWIQESYLAQVVLGRQKDLLTTFLHQVGVAAQETGDHLSYYVNLPMILVAPAWRAGAPDSSSNPLSAVFRVWTFSASALEHGVIEQLQGNPSSSAVKAFYLANAKHQKLILGNQNTSQTVAGLLSSETIDPYPLDWQDRLLQKLQQPEATMLLPSGLVQLGDWIGTGYALLLQGENYTAFPMVNPGGYLGGFGGSQAWLDPDFANGILLNSPDIFDPGPATQIPIPGADPVNMLDGSFMLNTVDLSVGQPEPRGFSFARHYSSNRRYRNIANMAHGWTHNYIIKAAERSDAGAGLGKTTPQGMAAFAVAMRAAYEVFTGTPDAANPQSKRWAVTALIAEWAVDQLKNNAVTITMGADALQFIKQPNGTYTAPAGVTMTLTKPGGYKLEQRHGNSFNFDPIKNRVTSIVDQHGKTMPFTYLSDGRLSTVKDGWSTPRTLTFSYNTATPPQLTSISDGTARSVAFGYSQGDLTSVTDPEGKVWRYEYDDEHKILKTKDPTLPTARTITQNTYDGFGRVIEQRSEGDNNKLWKLYFTGFTSVEEDPQGGRKLFYYDEKQRSLGIKDANDNRSRLVYDGQDHVVQRITPKGEVTTYEYNADHNLTKTIDPLLNESTRFYDAQLRLDHVIDFRGNTTSYTYNSKHHVVTITGPPANDDPAMENKLTFAYADHDGTLISQTDQDGVWTVFGYDIYGELIQRYHFYPVYGTESYLYDSYGNLVYIGADGSPPTQLEYNKRRQLTKTTVISPSGDIVTELLYDDAGNLRQIKDPNGNITVNTYSATQKLLTRTLPTLPSGTPVVVNSYDSRDWLDFSRLDPLNETTDYEYDAGGRMTGQRDPLSRLTAYGYDPNGQRISVTSPLPSPLQRTQYAFNGRGEQESMTDAAGFPIAYSHDHNGNQTEIRNRNNGPFTSTYYKDNRLWTTQTPTGKTTTRTYNKRGLLASLTEPSTQQTTFLHDNRGRLATKTDLVGSATYTYNQYSSLKTHSENSRTITRDYNDLNRMTNYTDEDGNVIQYQYDNNGNLTRLTYPGGTKSVNYAYDSHNRLITVTDWANRVTSIDYDLAGRVTSITRPNGSVRSMVYDAAGQTKEIKETFPANGKAIAYFKLDYDEAGRIKTEFIAPIPVDFTEAAQTITYDADNRIATFNGTPVAHDDDGNMTSGPVNSSAAVTHTYDARNRLTAVAASGSAPALSYSYDSERNRTAVTQGGQTTRYAINPAAALSQVLVRTKPGEAKTYYVYGLGLLYEVDDVGNTLTYHYDYRGSTVAVTDQTGQVKDRVEYSTYGQITRRTGTTDTPFLYNGRYGVMTDANGLLYMRARYYNAYLRRFLNADPIGFAGGLNFYAYADGNPISLIDPFGLWSTWTSVGGFGRMVAGGLETAVGYTFAVASGTAAVGTSPTVAGAVGFGALAVGGAAVGAHGIDTAQAGFRQMISGEHVDSLTSQNLQAAGMSPRAANLTDAGIGVVGTLGAGLATAPIRASTIAATDPLAQGLNSGEILSMWETGSRAVNAADWAALGGQVAPEAALYRALLMENGINMSGQAYQLTTTGLERLGQSILLAPTGLTPAAAQGAGYLGSGLNAVNGAVDWFGRPISNGGK